MSPILESGDKKQARWKQLVNGAVLQCIEAATLGMPFEVWKTRMGRNRNESTMTAFRNVYIQGGRGAAGVSSFWAGLSAKLVESASKGAILLWSKEILIDVFEGAGLSPTPAGLAAGAGAGVCQVSVMAPCTFLITAVVNNKGSLTSHINKTYTEQGIRGFYRGASAVAFRQATNWASRQGLTEWARGLVKKWRHNDDPKAKLTIPEELLSGTIGGSLSCWNQPFEVARIEMQARAVSGQSNMGLGSVLGMVYKEKGPLGLYQGVIPRIGLSVWQTLFMVTGAKLIRERLNW